MPYIGKEPVAGNFVLLDSITTSATATYALTKDSVAYSPESARNMIVSLNGVTQAPETAFTVSGSNITFSSALTASDVIDYILVLGDVLSVGTPSDGTVGTSQMSYPLGNFSSTGIDDNATSTAITIDSSQNVGVGTASPSDKLNIVSSGDVATRVESTGATAQSSVWTENNSAGINGIFMYGSSRSPYGAIAAGEGAFYSNRPVNIMSDNVSGTIKFSTGSSGGAERMRIDSSGDVLVNTTTTLTTAALNAGTTGIALRSSNLAVISRDGGAGLIVNRKTSDGDLIDLRKDNTTVGSISNNSSNLQINGTGALELQENGTTRAYVESTGFHPWADNTYDLGTSSSRWQDLYLSGQVNVASRTIFRSAGFYDNTANGNAGGLGISGGPYVTPLNGSGSATDNYLDIGSATYRFQDLYLSGGAYLGGTGAANHLDDYEEGSWNPSLSQGSATVSGARYVKVGRLVYVEALLTSFTDRSTAAVIQVGNLPFTSSSDCRAGNVSLSRFINRSSGTIVNYLGSSRNYLHFYAIVTNADYEQVSHSHLSASNSNIYISITYEAA